MLWRTTGMVLCAVVLTCVTTEALDLRPGLRVAIGYEHVETWDGKSSEDPWLRIPFDVAVSEDNHLYICDMSRRMVFKSSLFVGAPDGSDWILAPLGMERPFRWPAAVAVTNDPERELFVADFLASHVLGYDENRLEVSVMTTAGGAGDIKGPRGIAYTPGFFGPSRLYITDFTRNCVFRLSDNQWSRWGERGSTPGQFKRPCGIACSVDGGFVYVVDRDNHRIQQFDGEGHFVKQWGGRGDGPGRFAFPEGIAVSPTGAIFVTDTGNDRVQKFSATGGFIYEWGRSGGKDDAFGFDKPRGIAVGTDGHVYVCDTGNGAIKVYRKK